MSEAAAITLVAGATFALFAAFAYKRDKPEPNPSSSSSSSTLQNSYADKPGHASMVRLMLPDDSNPAGNVHGGTTLKLIEQVGWIVAARHCNLPQDGVKKGYLPATARIEHTDFLQAVYVGDILHLHAKLVFCSPHSMLVVVHVEAEDVRHHQRRHTNTAKLWYVAIESLPNQQTRNFGKGAQLVPPLLEQAQTAEEKQLYANAQLLYHSRKQHQEQDADLSNIEIPDLPLPVAENSRSPDESHVQLSQLMLPSDCVNDGAVQGGAMMKLMDSAAGIVAARHCLTNVATVSLEAMDFVAPVYSGYVIFISATMAFTSAKMMEIEVVVEAEHLALVNSTTSTRPQRYVAIRGFFKFVSLNPQGKTIEVPQLKIATREQYLKYLRGKVRYERSKQARQKS